MTDAGHDPIDGELAGFLPDVTRGAWRKVAGVVPAGSYLVGGTALTVHLKHRVSKDLDFFTAYPFDAEELESRLRKAGDFEITRLDEGTINGMMDGAKLQILDASDQEIVDEARVVAGIEVAGVGDILATKLRAVGGRGELRDYFDLQRIEQLTPRRVEDGMRLYLRKYGVRAAESSVAHIVESLGYFEDVADDPFLPESRAEVERYWRRRQVEIAKSIAKFGL